MTERSSTENPTSRRDFLRRSLITGAGVAAVVAGARTATATAAESDGTPTVEQSPRKGYRLTRHIRDYYKTAAL